MRIYDLSITITSRMLNYPGQPKVLVETIKNHNRDGYNLSFLQMSAHSGTHIDLPKHHLDNGQDAVKFPLQKFIGEAVILNIKKTKNQSIALNDLKGKDIRGSDIVIVSTGWEEKIGTVDYFESFPYFSATTADYLIKRKIKAIGCDLPSVDPAGSKENPFHHKILKANIGIIESLQNLQPLRDKGVFFIGLPLKIFLGDGSPIRAVAMEKNNCCKEGQSEISRSGDEKVQSWVPQGQRNT